MKPRFTLQILVAVLMISLTLAPPAGAIGAHPPSPIETGTSSVLPSRAELESELGRQLTFKERLLVRQIRGAQKRPLRKQTRQAKRSQARVEERDPNSNGMAIASLICGIVGLIAFGVILGTLAIIFGAVAYRKSIKMGAPYQGMAPAGMILGTIGLFGAIILIAIM